MEIVLDHTEYRDIYSHLTGKLLDAGDVSTSAVEQYKIGISRKRAALVGKQMGKSQRQLADDLQLLGLDIDKNAVQRIEAGKRFVTDIELVYISKALNLSYEELLSEFSL